MVFRSNISRWAASAAVLVSAVLLVTGCGSRNEIYGYQNSVEAYTDTAAAEEPGYGTVAMKSAAYADMYTGAMNGSESTESASAEILPEGRKLIRDVYLSLETKTFDQTMSSLRSRVSEFGGYVESLEQSGPSGRDVYSSSYSVRNGNICARIPSDRADAFIEAACGDSNITYRSDNVRDVTLSYTDTQSRIESLRIEQKRLNELMEGAEDIESVIALEQRSADVRYEIESYESQLRVLDNQIDYTSVNISINEVYVYTPETISTGDRIRDGFSQTLEETGNFFRELGIWLIVKSPAIVIFLAVLALIVLAVRMAVRKIRSRKSVKNTDSASAGSGDRDSGHSETAEKKG